MKEKVIIKTSLEELLNVLDPKALITVFTGEKDHYESMRVMQFLCDAELMRLCGEKAVTGISVVFNTIHVQLEY